MHAAFVGVEPVYMYVLSIDDEYVTNLVSFCCRCEVSAEPQAGGADSREGEQGPDGAHATESSRTLRQVRPAAAPAA